MLYLYLLGRILLGGYFIGEGIKHFRHLSSYTGYAASKHVPMPREAVMLTGAMLIVGGLGVLLGVWIEFAVFLLSLFLVIISFKMHDYWNMPPESRPAEEINFKKNLGLLGAVLMLLAIPTPWILSLF